MHIYYPLEQHNKEQRIDYYQFKNHVQKLQVTNEVERLLTKHHNNPDYVFLLNESFFDLVRYSIEGEVFEPLRIDQLNNLIENKIQEAKKEYMIHGQILLYDIDHISVNGEAADYLLGQQGKLERDIFLVFVKPSLAFSLPNLSNKKTLAQVYPASYFTIHYITKQLNIPSFGILSFYEKNIKLILIKDGFYHDIISLNRGLDHLKQILISNNIIDYLYKTDRDISVNSLAESILKENFSFYIQMIIDWIKENTQGINNFIINYPEFPHQFFKQIFIELYQQDVGGYLIPNKLHQQLTTYERSRKPSELDVLSFLNFSDTKELV